MPSLTQRHRFTGLPQRGAFGERARSPGPALLAPCAPDGQLLTAARLALPRGRVGRGQPPRCALLTLPSPGRVLRRAGLGQEGTSPAAACLSRDGTRRFCLTSSPPAATTLHSPNHPTNQTVPSSRAISFIWYVEINIHNDYWLRLEL